MRTDRSWTVDELHQALEEFEDELRRAGLSPASIDTYVGRSRFFIRWLDGDFHPRGPNSRR